MSLRPLDSRGDKSRPVGVMLLSVCLTIYGFQSLAGAIQLFPMWLEEARNRQYGSVAFIWMELALAVAALGTAYGLWRQRRWARIPGLVVALLSMGIFVLISGFAFGDVGGRGTWVFGSVLLVLAFALSIWVVWYIWRHT